MSFKVCLFYHSNAEHHRLYLGAAKKGFARHGITVQESDLVTDIDCDLACIWGHNRSKQHIIQRQRQRRKDYLVFERGYIGDREHWTSIGFNGLNGRADFQVDHMPGDRWEKHFGDGWLKPWKKSGAYILLIGQVKNDASVMHTDHVLWLKNMVHLCRATYPEVKMRFRPHPVDVKRGNDYTIEGTEKSTRPLEKDLAGACCVVTYNSNTGVNAILAGVPTVAVDPGSMVYHIAAHNITEPPMRPNRQQWAHNMAYCQWSLDKIKNGDAWDHLKQRYQ